VCRDIDTTIIISAFLSFGSAVLIVGSLGGQEKTLELKAKEAVSDAEGVVKKTFEDVKKGVGKRLE
jgi:hypothetical protein